MAVLHSFWWEEGDRAFGAVLAADSTCAMAHWGLALNAWGNPFAGGPAGPRWPWAPRRRPAGVGAAGADRARAGLHRGGGGALPRRRGHPQCGSAPGLRGHHGPAVPGFSQDVEVAIYYALALVATAPRTDTTFAQQKRAIAILDPLFARYPDHPGLAHYIIHSTDSPRLASLGLKAARRYANIAPAAPHAQHMPSHIFVRLGLWDETIARTGRRSRRVWLAKAKGTPGDAGRAPRAGLRRLRLSPAGPGLGGAAAVAEGERGEARLQRAGGGYNRTAMAARVPLERGDWAAAAEFRARRRTHSGRGESPSVASPARSARRGAAARRRVPRSRRSTPSRAPWPPKGEPYWARVAGSSAMRRRPGSASPRGHAGGLALARGGGRQRGGDRQTPGHPGRAAPGARAAGRHAPAAGRYARRAPRTGRPWHGSAAGPGACSAPARAAELAGDREAAVAGYREFLGLMASPMGIARSWPPQRRSRATDPSLTPLLQSPAPGPHPSPEARRGPGRWPGTALHLSPW